MGKGKFVRRASVLLGVVGISFAFAAAAWADAPGPLTNEAQVVRNADNTITVTVQGTWEWIRNNDCNDDRYAAGWAVDWNDANQPGNVVNELNGVTYDVGALAANSLNPQDNNVYYYSDPPRCGVRNGGDTANDGNWGPLSHTYAADTTELNLCVVTYDIHEEGDTDAPKTKDLIAGGSERNKDNSVEAKQDDQPGGQICLEAEVPVIPPPNVSPDTGGQTPPPQAAPALAFTGSSNGPLLATGLGMLTLGGIALFAAKRRRSAGELS
jgi:hypothetical protein